MSLKKKIILDACGIRSAIANWVRGKKEWMEKNVLKFVKLKVLFSNLLAGTPEIF